MSGFIKKYFKEILLTILTGIVIFLLVKILTPASDKSELLKYKLEQLDTKIDSLNVKQKQLTDSILIYKKDIQEIDKDIENIKTQKTVINNYYVQKAKDIPGMTNQQVDSALRKRYKF